MNAKRWAMVTICGCLGLSAVACLATGAEDSARPVLDKLRKAVEANDSDTNQPMGRFGYPLGTILVIEGRRNERVKGDGLDVLKVNGLEVVRPITIRLANVVYPFNAATNTICKFKGSETTFIVGDGRYCDPETGPQMGGRYFEFRVTEVVSPETVKVREKKSPNQASQVPGANTPPSGREERQVVIAPEEIRPANGYPGTFGYIYRSDGVLIATPDSSEQPAVSELVLLEDRKPLGPAHTLHADIQKLGTGRYSHWSDGSNTYLWFSASDNSDPRSNGKKYVLIIE